VFDGASPLTDIGALQAMCGRDTLFQVASQFNCLESPGPYVTRVSDYFHDPTQGPRASVSAFPATLLRHYWAPGPHGDRFAQETGGPQIGLLADATWPGVAPNGYLTGEGVSDPDALAASLETRFGHVRVGVHDRVQVVLGYDWDGAVLDSEDVRIAQVFTSTVAGGAYGAERRLGEAFEPVAWSLLRAAYLGTLLAAEVLGKTRVVLTLIGGGVFGNPTWLIWDAILWAVEKAASLISRDLDVVVNGRNLRTRLDLDTVVLPAVRERGGAILTFGREGLLGVRS
jgi:hypothetical protein